MGSPSISFDRPASRRMAAVSQCGPAIVRVLISVGPPPSRHVTQGAQEGSLVRPVAVLGPSPDPCRHPRHGLAEEPTVELQYCEVQSPSDLRWMDSSAN
jgi:hypothetical protein